MAKYLAVGIAQVASSSMHADLGARKRENWEKLAFYFDQIRMRSPTVDLVVEGLGQKMWMAPDQVERFKD
jgi:hypothetical protein